MPVSFYGRPSIPPKALRKVGVGQRLNQFSQFQDGVQLLHIRRGCKTIGQVVSSVLVVVQEAHKLPNGVVPSLRLGAPVNGSARLGSRGNTGFEAVDVRPLPFGAGQWHWSNSGSLVTPHN